MTPLYPIIQIRMTKREEGVKTKIMLSLLKTILRSLDKR